MELEPPKWLNELEQRLELLKKHKLQHEVGCGAACLKCKEKCPGLELHFWRKICTNCKCSANDHYTEESSDAIKFEILTFKKDADKRIKSFPKVLTVLAEKSDSNDKLVFQKEPSANTERKEVEFDWVPDVPSEMALEYMASLPSEKLPIKDTPGGVNRKQLWKTQIPLTDIAPDHMAKMDDCEKLRFQNFLETVRNEIVGQGRVQRMYLKPFMATSSFCKRLQEPQSSRRLEKSEPLPQSNLKLPSFYYNKRLDSHPHTAPSVPTSPLLDRENNTCQPTPPSEKPLSDDNANKLENLHLEDVDEENNNEVMVDNEKDMQCAQCQSTIASGSVVVTTKHGGLSKVWHPQCFVCTVCQELLVDLMYFFFRGKVYCLRHYATEKKLDRCNACDELIFSDVFTMAPDNKVYHYDHFCCFECDSPLGGKQYVEVNNQPVCLECYNKVYAIKCQTCNEIVQPNEQRVSHKESTWHARPQCFICSNCSKSLLGQRVTFKSNAPFCSTDCVTQFTNQ